MLWFRCGHQIQQRKERTKEVNQVWKMGMGRIKCEIPNCRNKDITVKYYGKYLCNKHWMCSTKYLKQKLNIKEDEKKIWDKLR